MNSVGLQGTVRGSEEGAGIPHTFGFSWAMRPCSSETGGLVSGSMGVHQGNFYVRSRSYGYSVGAWYRDRP